MAFDVFRNPPKRDWRRGWTGPVLVFFLLLLFSLWWLGVFHQPQVREAAAPLHYYLYQPYSGPYVQLDREREKLLKTLPAALRSGTRVTVIQQESGGSNDLHLIGQIGVLLSGPEPDHPAPWSIAVWPRASGVLVTLHANPAIASWKAYGALSQWCKARGISQHYPIVELAGPGDAYQLWMPLAQTESSRP